MLRLHQLQSLLALGEDVGHANRELFVSEDYDDNPVSSVEGICYVQHDKEIREFLSRMLVSCFPWRNE